MLYQGAQDPSSIIAADGKIDECNLLDVSQGRTESLTEWCPLIEIARIAWIWVPLQAELPQSREL